MTRHMLSVSLAAFLAAGGFAAAQTQQNQDTPAVQQDRTVDRPDQSGTETGATGERDRQGGMREMRRMHRMMQSGERRMHGMSSQYGMSGMRGMAGHHGMMMQPHMMRMMFIILDTDGDGALSLEEIQAVHERFFNAIDADGDDGVTLEEMQGFMRGGMPAMEEDGAEDQSDDQGANDAGQAR